MSSTNKFEYDPNVSIMDVSISKEIKKINFAFHKIMANYIYDVEILANIYTLRVGFSTKKLILKHVYITF